MFQTHDYIDGNDTLIDGGYATSDEALADLLSLAYEADNDELLRTHSTVNDDSGTPIIVASYRMLPWIHESIPVVVVTYLADGHQEHYRHVPGDDNALLAYTVERID